MRFSHAFESLADGNEREFSTLLTRALIIALGDTRELEGRVALGFQQRGIFPLPERDVADFKAITAVVTDVNHNRRVPLPLGPWIVIADKSDSKEVSILNVAEMLLSNKLPCRKAALSHFDYLLSFADRFLTPLTSHVMKEKRGALLTDSPSVWRPAAMRLYDAFSDDWLLCCAGFVQAMECNRRDDINHFLEKLLRPSLDSISSIDLKWWTPHSQREEIAQAIASIADHSPKLADALEGYYREFGHLPFTGDLGVSQLIRRWELSHGPCENLWDSLHNWAASDTSPVRRFHIVLALLEDPSRIPQDHTDSFWIDVRNLIAGKAGEQWHTAWSLRCQLACHFTHYLECAMPWNDGERICAFAWWATERIAENFVTSSENLDYFADNFFTHSNFLWELAYPVTGRSRLRHMTLNAPSLWQASIVPSFAVADWYKDIGPMPDSLKEVVDGLIAYYILKFPFTLTGAVDCVPVFGYERSFSSVVDTFAYKWQSETEGMSRFIDFLKKTRSKTISEALLEDGKLREKIDMSFLGEEVAFHRLSEETITELLQNEDQIKEALLELDSGGLNELISILVDIACSGTEKWRVFIPNYLASACLASTDNEQQHLLFCLTAQVSVATDTTSAMKRLLSRSGKTRYQESSKFLKKLLQDYARSASPWLAGRIRPVIALL